MQCARSLLMAASKTAFDAAVSSSRCFVHQTEAAQKPPHINICIYAAGQHVWDARNAADERSAAKTLLRISTLHQPSLKASLMSFSAFMGSFICF